MSKLDPFSSQFLYQCFKAGVPEAHATHALIKAGAQRVMQSGVRTSGTVARQALFEEGRHVAGKVEA